MCNYVLAKSLTGEEIAHELITVLQVQYGVGTSTLLPAMHDRASTNTLAMTTVKVLYPEIVDVGCFGHTLDHVGKRFCTPTLNEFNWINRWEVVDLMFGDILPFLEEIKTWVQQHAPRCLPLCKMRRKEWHYW